MEQRYLSRLLLVKIVACYLILSGIFYGVAHYQINYREIHASIACREDNGSVHIDANRIRLTFPYQGDEIHAITIPYHFLQENEGTLEAALTDEAGRILWQAQIDMADVQDSTALVLAANCSLDKGTKTLHLLLENSSLPTNISAAAAAGTAVIIEMDGAIKRPAGSWYWYLIGLAGMLGVLFYTNQQHKERRQQRCVLHTVCSMLVTYRFLIKQLVSRDFKTKYKRSALGALWSLLNPLCTMAVQYVVFSTIFRSSIRNYPVYLLSASVLFNFFTESTGGGLVSIVGNASLITKVYVPKYIYPVTKVLSTSINLLISMVPLFVVILVTGEQITWAYLLIPYLFLCLLLFCAGMAMILSAFMVFFRDMQFLWGIITLLWMYATPLFYPESIIPGRFRFVLELNPMYHYISFFRTILMEHVSPQMDAYAACLAFSFVVCLVGTLFFNRCQKKFALYL